VAGLLSLEIVCPRKSLTHVRTFGWANYHVLVVKNAARDPSRHHLANVGSSNTRPERVVRSALHRLGYRFRLSKSKLPGSPDVILRRHLIAVFVNGCFWHRHGRCRLAYSPKSNIPFWEAKFAQNVERDKRTAKELKKLGWRVVTIWECETRDDKRLARAVRTRF